MVILHIQNRYKVYNCPDVAAILQFNWSTKFVSTSDKYSRKLFLWSFVQAVNHWLNSRSWHVNTVCSQSLTPKLLSESTIVNSLFGTALCTRSVINSSRWERVQFANQWSTVDICVCTSSPLILPAKYSLVALRLHAQRIVNAVGTIDKTQPDNILKRIRLLHTAV